MTESALLRVIIGLVLVVAAILASAWLARRRAGQRGGGNLLKQVAALPLGARQSVVVIEVDKTWLVVGVSPNQLTTLHHACRRAARRRFPARLGLAAAGPGAQAPLARDPHEFPQTHDLLRAGRHAAHARRRGCWGWRCSRPASWPRPPCPP